MDNSAEYLLQFFQVEEAPEGFDSSLPQAFSRMMETQDVLNSLRDMQVSRLKIVEDIMPRIWEKLWSSYTNHRSGEYYGFSLSQISEVPLSESEAMALQILADKFPESPLKVESCRASDISTMLEEVLAALKDDDSLPNELRLYVLRVIYEVRKSLDECKIGVEFNLSVALQKLFSALFIVEKTSEKPSLWDEISNTLIQPFIAAVVSEGAKHLTGTGMDALLQLTSA